MSQKLIHTAFILLLAACVQSFAGEKLPDAAIKQKLLGFWGSPRHCYLYKNDGVRYMCPVEPDSTTNKWDVRNGVYYEHGDACQIITLTDKKFIYHGTGKDTNTYSYQRKTKKQKDCRFRFPSC